MREPRLSVIIPVYNGAAFLAEAIASIQAQHYRDLEVVVVDDGSTDGTTEVAARFAGVRRLVQGHRGPAAARNRGLQAADGDLVAFLDADDWWSAVKLAVQVPRLLDDPQLDAVSGHIQCLKPIEPSGANVGFVNVGGPRRLPSLGALVARRRAFDRVGLLDESLRCGEDIEWFMRARECGLRSAAVAEVVLYYRLHGRSTTYGTRPDEIGYTYAVKKLLDARRGTGAPCLPRR
jgi:glycosyltransferase involved in cell wall biosynthesis